MKVEKKEDEVEFTETEINAQAQPEAQAPKEFPFTDEQKAVLDEKMNQIRANHILVQDLAKINREISDGMHEYIREIHPDLVGVAYQFNPHSHKIQFQKPQ